MRWVFVGLLIVHALLHLLGFAKAFGLAELGQLTQPIARPTGAVWLLAAALLLAATGAFVVWPRGFWMVGLAALVVSQAVISSSWTDAKAGTLANALLALSVAHGFLTQGPMSFRAAFDAESARGLARVAALPPALPITEADLATLPEPVQRYLRLTGALGRPRPRSYRVRFRGRIRGSPTEPWMPFEAVQQSFADEPTRLFLMEATMHGAPVEAFHRFLGPTATFQVSVAGAVTVVDARGPEMDRAETVTLFNDMCIMAPGTLLSPSVRWEPIDDRRARASFTNGAHTIEAVLHFDAEGRLVDFVSDDRMRASRDGSRFTAMRFSTPLRDYRAYGPLTLAGAGEARWHAPAPEGEFVYAELELLEVVHDGG